MIQTLEDTTKQNVVSAPLSLQQSASLRRSWALTMNPNPFQIRVVSQEVQFSVSQLDELYNLFKVSHGIDAAL